MDHLWDAARAAAGAVVAWLAPANLSVANIAVAFAALLVVGMLLQAVRRPRKPPRMPDRSLPMAAGQALAPMPSGDDGEDMEVTRIGTIANWAFLQFETVAYIVLGLLLAATIVLGIAGTGNAVLSAALGSNDENTLVLTVDRMLFVLMVVEILRTVRDSFRSGLLVAEPFLIVGLIASIRRVLVITLESSQASHMGLGTPASQGTFNASMIELVVLGALILIMVVSIFLLRFSRRYRINR